MQELKRGFKIKDRYEIVEKRGEGTLGTSIYLGYDLDRKCDVIIRILASDVLEDEESAARFIQGASLAKKLDHPNILSLLDIGEDGDQLFLITNYEKGFFLNDYLEHRGELDEKESIRLIRDLADALNYAWREQKIIHRNISPDTILVAKGNIPMLTDFDLAKSLEDNKDLTLTGFTVGNPTYMSPEQARGESVDFHSDIYCIGLVLYQLLAGKPPFNQKSRMDTLRAQITELHKPITSVKSAISDATESLLDKMLAKAPKDRYSSWDELLEDLDSILNEETPSSLKRVVATKTSSKYKMQAIQMSAVVIPEQAVATIEKKVVTPVAEKSEKIIDVQVTDDPKSCLSKKIVFFAIGILICILMIVIMIAISKPNDNDKSSSRIKKALVQLNQPLELTGPEELVTVVNPQIELKARKASLNNIKQIEVALQMYANIYEGKYPKPNGAKGLDLLRSGGFLEVPQVFISPSSGKIAADRGKSITEATCDYVLVGGLSEYSDPKTPLLWTKPNVHKDFGIILYVNGDIEEVIGNNWQHKLKQATKW